MLNFFKINEYSFQKSYLVELYSIKYLYGFFYKIIFDKLYNELKVYCNWFNPQAERKI